MSSRDRRLFARAPRRRVPLLRGTFRAAALVLLASCRSAQPAEMPRTREPAPVMPVTTPTRPLDTSRLPPVPVVSGAALAPRLQYPAENQLLPRLDSTFVLGSVGSGDAHLSINGRDVPTAPNGAFIAWLAAPTGDEPSFDLVATRGADTARQRVRVRYPARRPIPVAGALLVDSGSVQPSRATRALPDEWVRVSVRAAANASVALTLADGTQQPLVSLSSLQAMARSATAATREIAAMVPAPTGDDSGLLYATDVRASQLQASATLVASRGTDTTRLTVPVVEVVPANRRLLGVLRSLNAVGSDTDRVVHGRTIPDGTYKWMLFPGTTLEITGKRAGSTRVRLDNTLDVWVSSDDIVALPEGSALPRRVTGGIRVIPSREWSDVVIGTGDRPAFLVEPDGRTITLTMYGVQVNPEISPILGNDTLVRRISWDQVGSDRARITLTLSQPVYGWLSLWDERRRAFVLRVRRRPEIDREHPLRGLTIAVDPGHPPAGATGPTGLYEGDAVLPVGKLLVDMLRARGAEPVLTRETLAPLGLTERGVAARRANAHAFVSIHLNALPDGVNPFTDNGTSTLFFNQTSEALARPIQSAMVADFGLRDLGVHYQNLAVARPSWFPAVLTEGLFVIMPEQEAAMRNPAFQRRYAQAIVDGLEAYFRTFGQP